MPDHHQLRLNHHRTESTTNIPKKPILQKFVDENGAKLDNLPTHVDSETDIRYVLWSDIQDRFIHLRYIAAGSYPWRVFFLLDEDQQMYV